MDKVNQLCMMANTEVIKEPRGFIKFIEIIIAIFAFATTTAYYGTVDFSYKCFDNATATVTADFSYSFKMDNWNKEECNGNATLQMRGDMTSSSQFYVFVGVMAFLYSLAAVLLYVFADDKYRQIDKLPAADLIITVIFVLLWLIASSAWADGVNKVKHFSDPTTFMVGKDMVTPNDITVVSPASYASLNVSIIFGFLNMCVWGGNIWFLYKETKWFSGPTEDPNRLPQPGSPENPQQRI